MSDILTDPEVKNIYVCRWLRNMDIRQKHCTDYWKIQKYLNLLICWFEEWGFRPGFRLSADKRVPVFFTKSWNVLPHEIEMTENVLTYVKSHRFLGVIFDKRLTWQTHIKYVIIRSKRKLIIWRCLMPGLHLPRAPYDKLVYDFS